MYIDMNVFPCFVVGNSLLKVYLSILDTLYVIVSDRSYRMETSNIWLRFVVQITCITFGSGNVD
jgi:hypothetical protein